MADATPAAAELAQVNNVDIDEVEGTGTDGKVTVDDVRAYIEDQGDEVTPVSQERIDELRSDADVEAPAGEPDRGDLSTEQYEGELPAVIIAGYWVKLGSGKEIPEENWGDIAAIVESPWTPVPFAGDSDETITGYRYDESKSFLVKTRGSAEVLLTVEDEASFVAVAPDRGGLLNYA